MAYQYLSHKQYLYKARTIAIVVFILPLSTLVFAQELTMENLLDRVKIEDFLTRYYYDLSQGEGHALSDYFTEDAVLDVDSTVATGHAEIAALYQSPEEEGSEDEEPESKEETEQATSSGRRVHMLLTNPIIEVKGDTATAHVIWTGVINEGVGEAPKLYEQGREDTELVKINDKWLIKRRYISSDSGTPDRFDSTFEPRENPLRQSR